MVTARRDTHYSLTRTVAPSAIVTVDDFKEHARIDHDDEDDLITALIASATQYGEDVLTWRAFGTQTLVLRLDEFPRGDGSIELPRPPLQSVTSVSYVDAEGDSQTLSTTVYGVDIYSQPGRVYVKLDQYWPITRDEPNAVTVTYVAGYGTAGSVPDGIKRAICQLVAHWYEQREPVNIGNIVNELPMHVDALFSQFSVRGFR